jgi:hypothetical protein
MLEKYRSVAVGGGGVVGRPPAPSKKLSITAMPFWFVVFSAPVKYTRKPPWGAKMPGTLFSVSPRTARFTTAVMRASWFTAVLLTKRAVVYLSQIKVWSALARLSIERRGKRRFMTSLVCVFLNDSFQSCELHVRSEGVDLSVLIFETIPILRFCCDRCYLDTYALLVTKLTQDMYIPTSKKL